MSSSPPGAEPWKRGRDEVLLSLSHWCVCSVWKSKQKERDMRLAAMGWPWRDAWHHSRVPTMWQGAGAGQEGRECSGERMMPWCCLPAKQWWWWPPVQPGGRRLIPSAGKCPVSYYGSWQASTEVYFHEISNTKCSWVMEVLLKTSVVFQKQLDWEQF